jgi:chromosome segregation ATPase
MFKIIKWTVISTAALVAGGFFLFGTHMGSYISTVTGSVREGIRGQIPVEFELKRAEKLIQEIDPEIQGCKRDLAQAEVDLDDLSASVNKLEQIVASEHRKVQNGYKFLAGEGNGEVRLASNRYQQRRFETELAHAFDAYNNNTAILKTKQALIERQTQAVAAAKQRLDVVRAEKVRLESMVSSLKVQKASLDALAAGSQRFDLDDSSLSKAKEVLANVKERLDVTQKMLEYDMFPETIGDIAEAPRRDIITEIREHFDTGNEVQGSVVIELAPADATVRR